MARRLARACEDGDMRIAGLFTAETASVTNDRLAVTGGLLDGLKTSRWPATHRFTVVVLLRPEAADVGQTHHFDFHVTGPDGQDAGHSHCDLVLNLYRSQVPVVLEVPATMPVAGEYTLGVRSVAGDDEITFELVGPDETAVGAAVEGYALGLKG